MRIAERDQAKAEHRADDRIAALGAAVDALHRLERGFRGQRFVRVELVREHVEQHFRVRLGVDVAAILLEHLAPQRVGVDQVAVVRERDAERRVDVERLGLVGAFGAGGRIAAMGDADPALQQRHRVLVEHVAHQSVALVHAQLAAVGGGDAGGVLAAVLEHGQPVVELCRDFSGSDDSDDAAHDV